MAYLKNIQEAEDITQDVFIKLFKHKKEFRTNEEEKAWLIRVTINASKDVLGSWLQLYIEMDDGSTIGCATHQEERDRIFSDSTPRKMFSSGRFYKDPWKYPWIFNEPIDISKVKTIHIGSLSIDVNGD